MKFFCSRRMAFAMVIIFLLSLTNGINAQGQWSIKEMPPPRLNGLSSSEKAYLDRKMKTSPQWRACRNFELAFYEIYRHRHPQIGDFQYDRTKLREWRSYYLSHHSYLEEPDNICFVWEAFHVLTRLDPYVDKQFYYCGRYSRKPYNTLEKTTRDTVEEILFYMDLRVGSYVSSFLSLFDGHGVIDLNTDVEYYFRKTVEDQRPQEEMEHLVPLIKPERRAFLDDAAARGDFASVVATTAACPER